MKTLKNPIKVAIIAASLTLAAGNAMAEEVTWKMATPWGGGPWLERDAKGFAKNVEDLTGGRIKINVFPGGTLSNALKVTEAVNRGVVEIGHNWMAYDWGRDRTTALFAGYAGSPTPEGYLMWLYEGGGLELWQAYRDEEFNVVSFPCAIIGTEIFLHSNKKVQTHEDFKGLKLRTSGAWAEIASDLGASTIVMPGAEVYTSLDRGVIDATEWGSPEINKPTGFTDIAKYVVVPGMHQPGGVLECEVNKEVWAGLSEEDQQGRFPQQTTEGFDFLELAAVEFQGQRLGTQSFAAHMCLFGHDVLSDADRFKDPALFCRVSFRPISPLGSVQIRTLDALSFGRFRSTEGGSFLGSRLARGLANTRSKGPS